MYVPHPCKALNSLICADMPLRNYSLTHSCFLRGQADFLSVLAYGVLVLSHFYWPSLCSICLPLLDLFQQSTVIRPQYVPEQSRSSFLDNKFQCLQCCFIPDVRISVVIHPSDALYTLLKLATCRFQLFFCLREIAQHLFQ